MYTEPPVFPGRLDPNDRFRERRRTARRRRAIRRLGTLAVVIGGIVALVLNARFIGGDSKKPSPQRPSTATQAQVTTRSTQGRTVAPPDEIRGVHVTGPVIAAGKLGQYLALRKDGLNTLEVDVKDENGEVSFVRGAPALAKSVGAAKPYYDARALARKVHAAGLYLIGRVVVFQDPKLAAGRPDLAIRTTSNGIWTTAHGLAWTNPYDERVWDYNIAVARAAAEAGFDEIMFDYVRFPSDDLSHAVFPHRIAEPKAQIISRFVAKAADELRPLGVRVGAALFGLAATRDLGIGQNVRLLAPHLDVIHPMTYPCLYTPGQYNLSSPPELPGVTVSYSLIDFWQKVKAADAKTVLVPWLEDYPCDGYGPGVDLAYGPAAVRAQIDAVQRGSGTHGYLLWNPYAVYTASALNGG